MTDMNQCRKTQAIPMILRKGLMCELAVNDAQHCTNLHHLFLTAIHLNVGIL